MNTTEQNPNRPAPARTADVAIVGAGQLGSRYLQGLAKCTWPLRVWIADPSPASLDVAQERWAQAGGKESPHALTAVDSASALPAALDLALVTTSANVRESAVRDTARRAQVRWWVLEKVVAQSCEGLDALLALTQGAQGRWVNTPRRMMAWHRQLHEVFGGQQPLRVHVAGGGWGLACNAIHFLDLVAWWSGSEAVALDTRGLDAAWSGSKRPGFFEVCGKLQGVYANGSTLALECAAEPEPITLRVETPRGAWTIEEAKGMATGPQGQQIPGRMELQSEMTATLVESILARGRCELPTLEASVRIHRPFLQSMLAHWNRCGGRADTSVPLT